MGYGPARLTVSLTRSPFALGKSRSSRAISGCHASRKPRLSSCFRPRPRYQRSATLLVLSREPIRCRISSLPWQNIYTSLYSAPIQRRPRFFRGSLVPSRRARPAQPTLVCALVSASTSRALSDPFRSRIARRPSAHQLFLDIHVLFASASRGQRSRGFYPS
ncbi:hypothetical protein EXIGLDRAFT_163163 [Exidia glandulosa HHB12029]|uniref:Uncharacterized protein n=1 Tax=Exidia glandulosa HHB12029 TaxID=1314781 RepID=A0A165FFA9_EXIGL|nr:hypothetical protein EXIGLDRAFT_163163 [Exidia glandulosa HHB12029]